MTILSLISLFSCTKSSFTIESETFNKSDRPYYKYNSESDYYSCEPWNYEKETNLKRKYPLIVYLHCAGGAGKISYLDYLGYEKRSALFTNTQALDFQLNYPCFVLVPQTGNSWNNEKLIMLVEKFKKDYRIDTNRIYLIGYSMGGSGSYSFANAYYRYNKHLFAGIIRLAGQSQTTLEETIAKNTSIWLHIGLTDAEIRIQVTREAYNFLKASHPNAMETINKVNIPGYSGTTLTLTENNIEVAKKTEYNQVGHGINSFPFQDNYLLEWLFKQKLTY